MKSIVVCSGGMDSTVLAYKVHREPRNDIALLSFDYGQRHNTELQHAAKTAVKLGVPHWTLTLPHWSNLGSALTDPGRPVPEGHYAHETMKDTVVPNRNSIMLNVAVGLAMSMGAKTVYTGVHAGDHDVYPDCRPQFIRALNNLVAIANDGFGPPLVQAPFVNESKADIASRGHDLEVPWEDTWSCYKGGEIHCGRCSTCVERQEAFYHAAVPDPTQYADSEYWREVVDV